MSMPGLPAEAVRQGHTSPAAPAAPAISLLAGAALLLGAALWLALLWNLPVELRHFRLPVAASVPLEIVLLFAALAAFAPLRTGVGARWVTWLGGLATVLMLALKLAELIVRASLGRPLSPLLDVHLAPSLVHLLKGTLGGTLGWLVLLGLGVLLVLVFLITLRAVGAAQAALDQRRLRHATLAACALLAGLWALERAAPFAFAGWRPVTAHASEILWQQGQRSLAMLDQRRHFRRAAADDIYRDLPPDRLLAGLGGADVLLMFVESYGRSALEQPRYATTVVPTLEAFERTLAEAGLKAASGYLTSPTVGGQSWLAHGALESGLWIDNQRLYDLLVAEGERLTLTRAFARAGYRTVAVKPAITMPWPEGPLLGFEQIYAAGDLGYAGRPYNWVTMPDQYTLAAFEALERRGAGAPRFVEVSLISSHAPWTPIPPVLEDWAAIGDGAVFARWAGMGDPPEVVWRDPERVRAQYTLAIDYVLNVLASYAARFVNARTLLIMVGDHEPAPLITGDDAARDVPIHVVSADPALLRPFFDWGLVAGMRPDPAAPVRRMDAFRDWFLGAFSAPPPAPVPGEPGA
jgi:hypothetical protein